MATLHVELVSVERPIWSGEATMVVARTTEGVLGVLPGHAPLLGQIVDGVEDDRSASWFGHRDAWDRAIASIPSREECPRALWVSG